MNCEERTVSPMASTKTESSRRRKSKASQEEIAATRHLRLVVESIAEDHGLSSEDKAKRMATFETLLDNVEKRLHYNPNKTALFDSPPELMLATKKTKKKGFVTRKKSFLSQLRGVPESSEEAEGANTQQNLKRSGTLELLEDARGEMEEHRNTANQTIDNHLDRVTSPDNGASVQDTDGIRMPNDDDTCCNDSIIGARIANSDDYTASICSIRSISTFEKDFIKNVIAEQEAQYDEISVSTFEQDFAAKQQVLASGNVFPMQVLISSYGVQPNEEYDDLTVDDCRSETTFERDAAAKQQELENSNTPPTQVVVSNLHIQPQDQHDDLTVEDVRSETTFEKDAAAKENSRQKIEKPQMPVVPSIIVSSPQLTRVKSEDSERSVSTFEKDAAARSALALKIGRKPVESVTMTNRSADDRSASIFEKDFRLKEARARVKEKTNAMDSKATDIQIDQAPNPFVPPSEISIVPTTQSETSARSQSRFEKDANKMNSKQPDITRLESDERGGFEGDVSRNMSRQTTKNAIAMPAIDEHPLVVELSANAIDRGMTRHNGSILSKWMCHCGLA